MQNAFAQILQLARGAWRFRWPGIALAWLVAVAGWIYVQTLPDTFETRTQVYVDTDSLLKPLLQGMAVSQDIMGQVGMMQAVMLSRPNLEKVAQKTDLMLGATTPAQQQAVVDSLAARITLTRSGGGRGRPNMFLVSFQDPEAKASFDVVRTLLDTFMEDSLGLKRSDSDVAQRFLATQIAEYEQKLTNAEQRLATFKQQNLGMLPGSSGDYYSRLQAEMATLNGMQSTLRQLSERRSELARQLSGEEPTYGLMGSAEGNPIDAQIARLRASRDQLLLTYTDKHPQVVALNETIARLQAEKSGGAKISPSVAPPGAEGAAEQMLVRSLDMNPVYQNLRMQLSQADADLAELRGKIAAQQGTVSTLQARVDQIPEIEAELARLNRDYDVNKQQFDTLLQRRESARITQQAEQSAENVKFRVIEPPALPLKATGPKRVQLGSMVLVLALASGLGLAVLLAQLRPTFSSRDLLQQVTGLPVLGTVSAVFAATVVPWYRRDGLRFAGALSLLFVVYALNLILQEPLRDAIGAIAG